MIHYSSHPDLYKVIEMFTQMSDEDKKLLFFDNHHFFTKLTKLHYKLIKGQCLMLVNEEGKTIGFVSLDLDYDDYLFITETYIDKRYRAGSLTILLEMFKELKKYMRPIRCILHKDNVRYAKGLETLVGAKEIKRYGVNVEYVIHI